MLTKGSIYGKTTSIQVLVLLLVVFCFLSVSLFISQVILQLVGYDILANPEAVLDHRNPENMPAILFMQVVYTISAFCIPPFVFAFLISNKPLEYLGFNKKSGLVSALLTALLVFSLLPAVNIMGELNESIDIPNWLGIEQWMKDSEQTAADFTEAILAMPNVGSLLFNLFMLALLPAIGEELLFRGTLQRLIADKTRNVHIAIWVSAILFSAIHMQFYGFIPRMVLGALFGYLLVWSGNIWYPIIGHFINNGSAVILAFLVQRGIAPKDIEDIGTTDNMFLYGAASFIAGGLLLFAFYRKQKEAPINPIAGH